MPNTAEQIDHQPALTLAPQPVTVEFTVFSAQLHAHITALLDGVDRAFVADIDKETLWNLYLDSFPAGTNEVFRKRREYDCSCCRQFVKELGGLVVIKDGKLQSIWGIDAPAQFGPVAAAMKAYVLSRPIRDAYLGAQAQVGTAKTHESTDEGPVLTWNHFSFTLPARFVHANRATYGAALNDIRTNQQVFRRALDELSGNAVQSVLELIQQGSLYRGDEWRPALEQFAELQRRYESLNSEQRELFTWAANVGPAVSRIRNHSIGTLLIDLSADMDLDDAVRRYERVVAPSNYKRPKAIFTARMLAEAQATVEGLGLSESLPRRFAVLDDVSVANTLFVDRDAAPRLAGGDVFASMAKDAAPNPRSFAKAEQVPLERFLSEVLPGATKLEVLLEGRHQGNLVSLLAPQNKTAPSLFKWSSGFSWAYAGNIADSMKERVKSAGGKVDGVLRFSIQWNDTDEHNQNDFDAHCISPTGEHIYYGSRAGHRSGGELDVDIINPALGTVAVENITWPATDRMPDGDYRFAVNTYSYRGGRSGFSAEIEFNGEIHSFDVRRDSRHGETVEVATVSYSKKRGFALKTSIPASASTGREMWKLKSGQFQRVQFVTQSPNFWDGEPQIGNRHLFFMLAGCVNPDTPNGFYNEFLRPELDKHKRVFEALGSRMRAEPSEDQLSGLGFSSTKRDTLVCRVTGKTTRVIQVAL